MHDHGKARITFGFRRGKLVALRDEDDNSRLEPDLVTDDDADDDGMCHTACPELAKLQTRGAQLPVSGPAHAIAELVEPPVQY